MIHKLLFIVNIFFICSFLSHYIFYVIYIFFSFFWVYDNEVIFRVLLNIFTYKRVERVWYGRSVDSFGFGVGRDWQRWALTKAALLCLSTEARRGFGACLVWYFLFFIFKENYFFFNFHQNCHQYYLELLGSLVHKKLVFNKIIIVVSRKLTLNISMLVQENQRIKKKNKKQTNAAIGRHGRLWAFLHHSHHCLTLSLKKIPSNGQNSFNFLLFYVCIQFSVQKL